MSLEPFNAELISQMYKDALERQKRWIESPAYQRMLANYRAQWKARPWYDRAWIRFGSKVAAARSRLGELIAGRRFDDD